MVAEVAVADEIAAAAADGQSPAAPVAVVRGVSALSDDGSTVRQLLRPGASDLFCPGPPEALELGRQQTSLLRRSVRRFSTDPVARRPQRLRSPSPRQPITQPTDSCGCRHRPSARGC